MTIHSEMRDGILLVTIDRPDARNALSLAMTQQLIGIWQAFRDDPACRVAILTGAGDRSFCAGADLKEVGEFYRSMTEEQRREKARTAPGLGGITRNLNPGKPIIAAVNGHCLAGGLEMALACDIRIASENASFGLPEIRWGLMPGAGGSQRLPRAIPLTVAMEMLLTGDAIDAQAAVACGLVSRVVAPDELLTEAFALARRIVRAAPLSVQAVRAAVYEGLEMSLDEGLELEQEFAEPLRQSTDVQEGLKAFIEKRDPDWKGK
jgi:enoyl-CoA hydratase/carnithine racemase